MIRKVVVVIAGVAEFALFLYLYNTISVAGTWTYVFAVSALFCLVNLIDSLNQLRVQRGLKLNHAIGLVTMNGLEQEAVRFTMSVFWMLAGIAAVLEISSMFAVWVLFAGAYAFRVNALLTIRLRRKIEGLEKEGGEKP